MEYRFVTNYIQHIYIYITNLLYIEPAIHIYWNMRGEYNQLYKNTMGDIMEREYCIQN